MLQQENQDQEEQEKHQEQEGEIPGTMESFPQDDQGQQKPVSVGEETNPIHYPVEILLFARPLFVN